MKKGDKIVLFIIFILVALSLLFVFFYRMIYKDESITAKIVQNQKIIEEIDLNNVNEAREWVIMQEDGGTNTIRVEKGRIRFIDANCPDFVCVHTGWLSQPGDIAVCLPHKLSIQIEAKIEEIDQNSY